MSIDEEQADLAGNRDMRAEGKRRTGSPRVQKDAALWATVAANIIPRSSRQSWRAAFMQRLIQAARAISRRRSADSLVVSTSSGRSNSENVQRKHLGLRMSPQLRLCQFLILYQYLSITTEKLRIEE